MRLGPFAWCVRRSRPEPPRPSREPSAGR